MHLLTWYPLFATCRAVLSRPFYPLATVGPFPSISRSPSPSTPQSPSPFPPLPSQAPSRASSNRQSHPQPQRSNSAPPQLSMRRHTCSHSADPRWPGANRTPAQRVQCPPSHPHQRRSTPSLPLEPPPHILFPPYQHLEDMPSLMGQLGVCPGRSRLDTIEQVHDQLCNRVLVGATIPTEAKRLRGWINEHDAWTQNVHPHALARDVIVAREHVGRAEFHLTEAEHKLDIFDGNLTPSQQDSQLAEAYRHYLRATWHTDLADCQIQNYCENNISMPT